MDENKDDEVLNNVKKMYKKFNIVYAAYAKMNNENDVIAICQVRGFDIRDKKAELLSKNTWITLNYLDIQGQKIILRFSKESIEFFTLDYKIFFESICDVLQRVLLPSELDKLNFRRFNAYPVFPTPFAIRKRFAMIKKENDIEHYDETESKFDDLLKLGSDTLDLANFPKLSKLVLDSLPLFNFIKYLIIPELQDVQVYQKLDMLLPECRFLRHVKVSNSADMYFSRFLTAIINSPSNISSLGFGPGASLTIDNLKEIRSNIINSKIHSLELNNSLYKQNADDDLSPEFYSLFDGQLGSQLWSLNMKETLKINFNLLLPKLQFITSLSFEDCDIEINDFFVALCESRMQNLTYLNLNKNDCADKIPKSLKFPSSLTHISVNDVSWKKNSLVTFFKFIFKQKDEIHLSIARAGSYREQWDELFNYLSVSKYSNIRTLNWDRNQVRDSLLNFLKRNEKLSYLSMSGCFSNNEPGDEKSIILSMFEYIKEASNLKTLIIKGNEESYLGEKFPVIIDACVLHPSISVLDLSFSRCGNIGIGYLIPLIKRGKLNVQILNIEGCYVQGQDTNVCIRLFRELTESASDVFVSFPQKENDELFESKLLKHKQNFQLLFRSKNTLLANEELENARKSNKYTYEKFLDSPFYLYPLNHYNPEVLFPVYFEEAERKQLNYQALKRIKAAQSRAKRRAELGKDNDFEEDEEESDEESEFLFANNEDAENGGMKFSEVSQRKILKKIVKDINTPKTPNDIAASLFLSSEAETQDPQNKNNNYDNDDNSPVASPSKSKERQTFSNNNSPHATRSPNRSPNQSPHRNIRRSPTTNNHQHSPKKNNENYDEDENNNYILSEFNKREIIAFKDKYKITKTVTFPKLKNPKHIMNEKWNKIDDDYSLESLFSILKNQKNTVPK